MSNHVVDLWWSDLRVMDRRLGSLLDPVEAQRAAGIERAADLGRFVVGALLLRVAVGAATGVAPLSVVVDRACAECAGPHGRPVVAGVHVSVAHAGALVLVATSSVPVGVDVEAVDRGDDVAGWVRAEAGFKATGSRAAIGALTADLRAPLPGHLAALALIPHSDPTKGAPAVLVHGPAESAAALAALTAGTA